MTSKALASNRQCSSGERRMEEELKCPQCSQFYCGPILLPCSHSVCEKCAASIQEPSHQFLPPTEDGLTPGNHENELRDFPDVDKISIISETDSGIVCNSRPSSYIGTPSIGNIYQSVQISQSVYGIRCPVCKKVVYLNENGYKLLPKNKVLETIVEKYCEGKHKPIPLSSSCQMCEHEQSTSESVAKDATVFCEQCEVFYCDACREGWHPLRGPLAKHNLVDPIQGKALQRAKNKGKEAKCSQHVEEHLSMYCLTCRVPVCYTCHQEGGHINHDVQALWSMCKAHKVREWLLSTLVLQVVFVVQHMYHCSVSLFLHTCPCR